MDIVIIDGLSFALPLFIMAIGGIYCEKSGVTMLAVEGLQGFGAFIGAFVAVAIAGNFSGDSPVPFYIAMIMAAVGGSIFALIHALLCLKFKANQVISGVVVNILAMALTAYLTKLLNRVVFGATSDKFVLTVSSRITIPGISKIPVLGAIFTNLYPFELVIVAVAASFSLSPATKMSTILCASSAIFAASSAYFFSFSGSALRSSFVNAVQSNFASSAKPPVKSVQNAVHLLISKSLSILANFFILYLSFLFFFNADTFPQNKLRLH